MSLKQRITAISNLLFRRKKMDAELDAEVQSYFGQIVERHVNRGLNEPEASRLAHLKLSHPELVKEQVRDARTGAAFAAVLRDINYALRLIRRNPAFAIVTILTLALGIGANSAIFSIVSRFVMQPLPVGDPATLLALHTTNRGECCNSFSWPLFNDLREQVKSFSGVAAYYELVPASIGGSGEPERVWGQAATANFFDVARVAMTAGRGFRKDEAHSPVVVIGHRLWQRRFAADPDIAGKSVTLSGHAFTVIGVAAPAFRSVDPILDCEFWVPLAELDRLAPNNSNYVSRTSHWIAVVGRLKDGINRRQAAAELSVLANRFAKARPDAEGDKDLGFRFETAGSIPPRDSAMITTFLLALAAVALLILAIACANVASMFLAQAAARQREMALRLALGATRRHLLRQLLTESLILAIAGGLVATAISLWATRALSMFRLPAPVPLDTALHVDWRVLLYTFLVSVAGGVAFGITPIWMLASPVLEKALKGGDLLGKPGRIWNLRNLLVIAQIAMSLVLLCSAGLFLRSLGNASRIDVGFHSRGVLILSVDPRLHGYSALQTTQFLDRLQQQVTHLPGVMSASYTDIVPLSGNYRGDVYHAAGRPGTAGPDIPVELYMVGPDYFETIGTPRIAGRTFASGNLAGPKTAIVNQMFAERFFPHENPIAQLVTIGGTTYRIIGLVRNIKARTIGETPRPVLYRSLEQNIAGDPSAAGYSILLRFSGDPGALASAVRLQIHTLDPALAIFNQQTMRDHLRDALFLPRLTGAVFGLFGALGLALAAVGLYGVVSHWVSQRTREIGIRLALGAQPGRVQRLIVRQGMLLLLLAAAPGLAIAYVLSQLFTGVLYGIAPHDTSTFAFVSLFLALIALLACWIPARHAAEIQPVIALRHE